MCLYEAAEEMKTVSSSLNNVNMTFSFTQFVDSYLLQFKL